MVDGVGTELVAMGVTVNACEFSIVDAWRVDVMCPEAVDADSCLVVDGTSNTELVSTDNKGSGVDWGVDVASLEEYAFSLLTVVDGTAGVMELDAMGPRVI